ncbi:MAG: hypothetical protein B7Z73_08285 [Planctomycetia bacterium 21-64-5]|nr:MAG: hypothetical protein B7Z73_08285 [Planctomycetia bacterium 21-64-5]
MDRAIAAIDRLLARPSLSRDEDDYLDVLSDLVYKYEQAMHPLEAVPDSDMLKHRMEARDLSRAELHRRTGIPLATIAAVLGGKRQLSRQQVSTLAQFFNVSSDAFALATELNPRAKRAFANGRAVGSRQSSTRKQTSTGQRHGRKSDASL